MKIHHLIIGLLAATWSALSFASPPDNAADVIKHLEFQGYDVAMNSKRIKATHAKELNILIKKYRGGMLTTSMFAGSEHGKKNRNDFIGLINKLNQKAAAARYYVDDEGDLIIEAYYPGSYNKQAFSAFLDAYNLERSHLSAVLDDLKVYLK